MEYVPCSRCESLTPAGLIYENGDVVCLDCHYIENPDDWFTDEDYHYWGEIMSNQAENTVTLTFEQLARLLDIYGTHEGFQDAIRDEYKEVENRILEDNPAFADYFDSNPVSWKGW